MYYMRDDRTDRERYLEDEIDQYRHAEDERLEAEREAREERQREYDERHEEQLRTADSWPEALEKQRYLMQREVDEQLAWEAEHKDLDESFDPYFEDGITACRYALELWHTVEREKQTEVDALKQRLSEIEDEIRIETANRVLAEKPDSSGFQEVARALLEDTP